MSCHVCMYTYILTYMHAYIQDPQQEEKVKKWDKKLAAYTKKRRYEESRVQVAQEKEKKSKQKAEEKQKEALVLQARVDAIKKVGFVHVYILFVYIYVYMCACTYVCMYMCM